MGLLTTRQLIDEVRASLAGRTDLDDTRIVRVLNMAQDKIAKVYKPNELEDVSTEPAALTAHSGTLLLSDITPFPLKIYSVVVRSNNDQDRKLTALSKRQFDAAFPNPSNYGERVPAVYVKFANRIDFYPIPDLDYPLYISMRRKARTLTTGSLSLTSELDAPDVMLIYWSLYYLYQSLGQPDKGNGFLALYQNEAKALANSDDLSEPDRLISAETSYLANSNSGSPLPWNDPFVRSTR